MSDTYCLVFPFSALHLHSRLTFNENFSAKERRFYVYVTGLVFYKCGDDVGTDIHDRVSNFEKNLILNETLTFNFNIEAVNNRTHTMFDNEDGNER